MKKPKCAGCLLEFRPGQVGWSEGGGPTFHFECRPGGAVSDAIEELSAMRNALAVAEARAVAAGEESHSLGWKLQLLRGDMARIEGQLDDVRRLRRDLEVENAKLNRRLDELEATEQDEARISAWCIQRAKELGDDPVIYLALREGFSRGWDKNLPPPPVLQLPQPEKKDEREQAGEVAAEADPSSD